LIGLIDIVQSEETFAYNYNYDMDNLSMDTYEAKGFQF